MASRTDVQMDWVSDPRALTVDSPSTEMDMQDLVDTLRDIEDTFRGMSEEKLLNASGKEDLGGSRFVGITAAMQNTLLAFEARKTPAQTGTVTGTPSNPVTSRQTMQDTSALFQTNNVTRGSFLVNFNDLSIADVYRVNSETELEVEVLVEGTTNTFTIGDTYKIWNIVQCNARGGNLTAVDGLGSPISPILPTAFTQVVIELSTSASIVESGVSGLTPTESAQLAQIDVLRKLMQNRMETDPNTGLMTIYDDDDTTVFLQGNIYEDVLASQVYRGRGIERRNRLT